MTYDVHRIREDFPVLGRVVNGHPLAYLDSANTSQKPNQVVTAVAEHYLLHNANVARAMHTLGAEATAAFEGARAKVAAFIGVSPAEVVFTKNASEALNLAAHTLGQHLRLGPGDEIVVSVLEHHSNIVPWQLLCERSGATLRWFDTTAGGQLDLEKARAEELVNDRTRIVAVAAVSNVLGTVTPMGEIAAWAHQHGALVVADASQAAPHLAAAGALFGEPAPDVIAFTGHKMLGPTGIGVLSANYELLEQLPPFLGGGEMIEVVRMSGSTYAPPPHRFEAGTPPIAQAVGLGAAVDYLQGVGLGEIAAYERQLVAHALEVLTQVDGLRLLGPLAPPRGGTFSFTLHTADGLECHPHDVMQLLDGQGIAVRGGHHCARPLHERLGIQASTRASVYLYNTVAEIDRLGAALAYVRDFFGGSK
ncbi:MAG: SufS family cysteine desulfurase [Propionibacteriaceae bacterium]|jgi:cysteine desulfurase/selenocysteine lyase|nr:SufS family cysteine desulfurase [Propionibacteriaceae bacterium]